MSIEFWGMTAFFSTTILFSITTLIYARKLAQAKRQLYQLKEKANLDKPHDCEKQYKK